MTWSSQVGLGGAFCPDTLMECLCPRAPSVPGCGVAVEAGPGGMSLSPCHQQAVHVDLLRHHILPQGPCSPSTQPRGAEATPAGAEHPRRDALGHPGHPPPQDLHPTTKGIIPTSPAPPRAHPPAWGLGWRAGGQTSLSGAGQTHSPASPHAGICGRRVTRGHSGAVSRLWTSLSLRTCCRTPQGAWIRSPYFLPHQH